MWFWGAPSERAALLFPGRREAWEHRGAPPAAGEPAGREEPGAGQGKWCSARMGESSRVLIWPQLPLAVTAGCLDTAQRAGLLLSPKEDVRRSWLILSWSGCLHLESPRTSCWSSVISPSPGHPYLAASLPHPARLPPCVVPAAPGTAQSTKPGPQMQGKPKHRANASWGAVLLCSSAGSRAVPTGGCHGHFLGHPDGITARASRSGSRWGSPWLFSPRPEIWRDLCTGSAGV